MQVLAIGEESRDLAEDIYEQFANVIGLAAARGIADLPKEPCCESRTPRQRRRPVTDPGTPSAPLASAEPGEHRLRSTSRGSGR